MIGQFLRETRYQTTTKRLLVVCEMSRLRHHKERKFVQKNNRLEGMLCRIYTVQNQVHMAIRQGKEQDHEHRVYAVGLKVGTNQKSKVFLDIKQG